jgi:hypothetical protein
MSFENTPINWELAFVKKLLSAQLLTITSTVKKIQVLTITSISLHGKGNPVIFI